MQRERPLVVVDGRRDGARVAVDGCLASLSRRGWTVVRGWVAPLVADRIVCTGEVATTDDARRALLAAVAGAGLVVVVTVERTTVDRLLDDLRRLGAVEHVPAEAPAAPVAAAQCTVPARRRRSLASVPGAGGDAPRWTARPTRRPKLGEAET